MLTFTSVSLAISNVNSKPLAGKASQVRINNQDGKYQLLVNGKPFYIKGAGLEFGDQEALVRHGGNSFRTWTTDNGRETGQAVLDRAHVNGLYVTMGLYVATERDGFDYDDPALVAGQLERIKAEVLRYKDHPAILMWAIGNELNLGSTNPKVWDAVNQVAQMIHQLDPNHPVMTTLAGFDNALIELLKARAYSLDLIGIQLYGDIANLQEKLQKSNWHGAYIVTEWGPTGHWEVPTTNWGAPIEDNSSQKAAIIGKRYTNFILSNKQQCLGSYVFLWGQKQERTPTWYSLFLESGESTEAVDMMSQLWTGLHPKNLSPTISTLKIQSFSAENNIKLEVGHIYNASIDAKDSDQDVLTYHWKIMLESDAISIGGDYENAPLEIPTDIHNLGNGKIQFKAPTASGNFRLFVYVLDGKGNAAHANIPFQVAVSVH